MEIRSFKEEDIIRFKREIADLIVENLEINKVDIKDYREYADNGVNMLPEYLKDGSAILIGAVKEGILCGFLWAYYKDEETVHISHIIVRQEYRAMSVGRKMIEILETMVRQKKIKKINLITTIGNTAAVEFYRRSEYVPTRIMMEKKL